jgi:cytochrome d ubiquinol oxidase subunit II
MDFPLLSALFAVFALTLYALLDGFDLGVGALLLLQRDERLRDQMIDSIIPTWDGNETWLIMAGVTLLAAFPIAYGLLLPALYIPLIVMLLALGVRGVSFEFRYQVDRRRRIWDVMFGLASIVAPLMQGLIIGDLLSGVSIEGERFSGSVFDVFSAFNGLIAVAVLAGYVVLGAAWLHLKATGALRAFAEGGLRWSTPIFAVLAVVSCIEAVHVQPGVSGAWARHGAVLGTLSVVFLSGVALLMRAIGRRHDALPLVLTVGLFVLGMVGLGLTVFPDIVPFHLTLWDAASGTSSHVFLLIGVGIVAPLVLAYSAFAYRVFRGKTPVAGWDL